MNLSRVLDYLGLTGWNVVEQDGKVTVTGIKLPSQKVLDEAWAEVQELDRVEDIRQEREAKHKENDHLLFEALAKVAEKEPLLKEWKDARELIKSELPYEEKKKEEIKR